MATLLQNANNNRIPLRPSQIESGKLAEAIYRNNTTYRKQLEAEIQKIEDDTMKTQRNLEMNQIAFRNQVRQKHEQWMKQQEKTYEKMFHYVYKTENNNINSPKKVNIAGSGKNAQVVGRRNPSTGFYHSELDDDEDDRAYNLLDDVDDDNYDDDIDNISIEEINNDGHNKKPLLLLVDDKYNRKQDSNKRNKLNQEQRHVRINNVPVIRDTKKTSKKLSSSLFNEKISILPLQNANKLSFDATSKRSDVFENNRLFNPVQSYQNFKSNINQKSLTNQLDYLNGKNEVLKLPSSSTSSRTPIKIVANINTIDARKYNPNTGTSFDVKSNSLNTIVSASKLTSNNINNNQPPTPQIISRTNSNILKQQYDNLSANSIMTIVPSSLSNNKSPYVYKQETMPSMLTKAIGGVPNTPSDIDFYKKSAFVSSTSSSFNKLPAHLKEFKISVLRSNNNSNASHYSKPSYNEFRFKVDSEISLNENKDSFLKSYELIDANSKQFKTKTKKQAKDELINKLPSAAINKQKFDSRVQSTFLKKSSLELQRQQQLQLDQQFNEQQKALKSQVLNDERFLNLVQSLGSL